MLMSGNIRAIRRLIWAYFILLIFEGVLRKWLLPGLSNPLLLVRAPIVIVIYAIAIHARIFPWNRWVMGCCLLAFLGLFAGLYVLQDAPAVALFGFQADFLHLPLIFIIPQVFDIQDVRKIGYWTLLLSIPMGLLMVGQFEASPTAWINAGAGEGSGQISGAQGHIRPAGTFSYILGPASFLPLVTALLFSTQFGKIKYPNWLLISSAVALVVGTAVSSSRTLLASVAIVVVCAVVAGTILQPFLVSQRLIMRFIQGMVLLSIAVAVATHLTVFSDGMSAFTDRVIGANGAEGSFFSRGLGYLTEPLELLANTPTLGSGLGMGTNAGSALLTGGQATFLLAEGEWGRIILESGPILGVAFLLLRVSLVTWLGWVTARSARQGNVLPFLLFGSCCPIVLTGQFGQPTELGFAVLGGGLTLAAMQVFPTLPAATGPMPRTRDARAGVAA